MLVLSSLMQNPFKNANTTTVTNMNSYLTERVLAMGERKRQKANTENVTKTQEAVRSMCVDATMKMLRGLHTVSDTVTYPDIARGMLAIANSTPTRCVCVGISPYENGILPPFATALAYSPAMCIGPTPSVQIMSQIMGLCASRIEMTNVNRLMMTNTARVKSSLEYASKFAMMLRCSYACTEAGVSFVNSSPVITSSVAKTCLSMSLFSEWLANIVEIHGRVGMKITVVSMGASTDRTINDAMSSYPTMSSNMNLLRMVNPAAISRMSVTKIKSKDLINNAITNAESIIETIACREMYPTPKTGYDWKIYPPAVLDRIVDSACVAHAVGLLADREPDQLLNQFTSSIEILYTKMSDYDLESMMNDMAVKESGNGPGGIDDNAFHTETMSTTTNTTAGVIMNPFENIEASASATGSGGGSQNTNYGQNRNEYKSDGPYGFTKRSQLGQLLDPTGKGVSQQVIIVDSMNLRCNEMMIAYKQVSEDMKVIVERQSHLMDMMSKVGIITDDTREDAVEFVTSFEEFCGDVMEKMETAKGMMEAMPAVIEGDRGIYEHETMPVAPLLRKDDGTTMKQYVYGPAMRSADTTGSTNTIANPTMSANAANPFETNTTRSASSNADTVMNTNLVVTGDKRYDTIATAFLSKSIKSFGFDTAITGPGAISKMKSFGFRIENFNTNLFEVMMTIVSQRMIMNDGSNPSADEVNSMIACMGSMSTDELTDCSDLFSDALMSDTSIVEFFKRLNEDENMDDDDDETDSDDPDED